MKRTLLLVIVLAGACSTSVEGGESVSEAPGSTIGSTTSQTPLVADGPPTPETLDAAVRAAAQLLLDSPGIESIRFGYDEDGELRVTSWADWRANGDVASVNVFGQGPTGRVEVGDTVLVIGGIADGQSVTVVDTWTAVEPSLADPPTSTLYVGVDVAAMAAGSSLQGLDGISADDIIVSSEPGSDSETRWRMVVPWGDDGTITREWLIDGSGYLRAWSWATSPGMILGSDSRIEAQLSPVSDPDPILLPEVGTEMNLDALGFPENVEIPPEE